MLTRRRPVARRRVRVQQRGVRGAQVGVRLPQALPQAAHRAVELRLPPPLRAAAARAAAAARGSHCIPLAALRHAAPAIVTPAIVTRGLRQARRDVARCRRDVA